MTRREFLNAVINGNTDKDVVAFAQSEIAKLDTALERRKTSPAAQKANAEQAEFRSTVWACLNEIPQSAAQIAQILGTTTAKVSGALQRIEGVKVCDFKPTGKGRAVKGYSRD